MMDDIHFLSMSVVYFNKQMGGLLVKTSFWQFNIFSVQLKRKYVKNMHDVYKITL